MQDKQIKSFLFLAGLLTFHAFFWKENIGLNALLFSALSAGLLAYNFPESRKEKSFWASVVGTLLVAAMIMFHHSDYSIFVWFLSWLLMVGIGTLSGLHDVLYGFLQGFMNTLMAWVGLSSKLSWRTASPLVEEEFVPEKTSGLRPALFAVPALIVVAFIVLYAIGNQDFAQAIGSFLTKIFSSLDWLKDLFSLRWLFFIGMAIFPISALIWSSYGSGFLKMQENKRYFIAAPEAIPTMQKINDQYWTAFLTLAMLNVLIMFFNVQEFFNLGNQAAEATASAMRYSVHFGTYILIFSIVVAMGLLFYFFSDDLNFIEKSPTLRLFAYAWIAQNAVMVVTVALRNYAYINNYGLAYKRVGVIFFLLLTLFGLFTMLLKIKDIRTFSSVLMLNGWSVYLTMILAATVNWDVFITRYNLTHTDPSRLDLRFLLQDVSDKNLHVLLAYKNQLPNKSYTEKHWFGLVTEEFNVEQMLEAKRNSFLSRRAEKGGIMSWNWIDEVNENAVK
jgi:hypothetical protein